MGNKGVAFSRLAPLFLTLAAVESRASDQLYDLSLEDLLQLKITSASKASDAVGDIPASVTILTRDDISLMGYSSLEELLLSIPGFYHIDTYEDFQIGVRGTVGGSLAFLINGVQQHPTRIKTLTVPDRSRSNVPINSIDRIEIIRGPSSVIYGNNAFLGSINIITNDPERQGTKASIGLGDNGYSDGYLRVVQESENGYSVLNIGGSRSDGIGGDLVDVMSEEQLNRPLMRPDMYQSLDGTLTQSQFSAEVSGLYRELEYGFRYSDMRYGIYALYPGFNKGSRIDLTSWTSKLGYSHSLSDGMEAKVNAIISGENYFVDPDFVVPNIRGYQDQSSNRIELEGLITQDFSNRLKWVGGINYRLLRNVKNNGDFLEIGYFSLAETDNVINAAAFFNTTYGMSEKFDLTAGYRVANVGDYDVNLTTKNEVGETVVESIAVKTRNDDAVKLAGNWQLGEQDSLKAIYSTATQDNSSIELVEPENIRTYELNYLHTGKKNTFSISLFDNDIRNIRRRTVRYSGDEVDEQIDNKSHWKTQGVEFILTVRPSSNVMAEVSGVHQRSEDLIAKDSMAGYSPKSQLKFKFGYGKGDWRYSASLVSVSEMNSNFITEYREGNTEDLVQYFGRPVEGYTLLNTNIRYSPSAHNWYLNVHLFNLTNAEIRYPANELVDFEFGAFGPSRSAVLSVGIDL